MSDLDFDLSKGLSRVMPGARWQLTGNSLAGLEWLDERELPSLETLRAAAIEDELIRSREVNFPDVSRYQVRQWMIVRLVSQGQAPDPDAVVDGVIDAAVSDSVQRLVLKDRWRNVIVVPRDHLLVNPVGAAMGLTPAEIDAQWPAIQAL